jgi:hypothetical protein
LRLLLGRKRWPAKQKPNAHCDQDISHLPASSA